MCACLFRTIDNHLTVIPKQTFSDCLRLAADVLMSLKGDFDIHVRIDYPVEEKLN